MREFDGGRYISLVKGDQGAGEGDVTSYAAYFHFAQGRGQRGVFARFLITTYWYGYSLQCPLGALQKLFDSVEPSGAVQNPGAKNAEPGAAAQESFRHSLQPPRYRGELAARQHRHSSLLNQTRGSLKILGRQRMLYRLSNKPVLLVPLAGAAMQCPHLVRLCLMQTLAQQVSKKMVVPIPLPPVVQRHYE